MGQARGERQQAASQLWRTVRALSYTHTHSRNILHSKNPVMDVNIHCIHVYTIVWKCTYRMLQGMQTLSPTRDHFSCCLCAKPIVCLLVDCVPLLPAGPMRLRW